MKRATTTTVIVALILCAVAPLLPLEVAAAQSSQCHVNIPTGTIDLTKIPTTTLNMTQFYVGHNTTYDFVVNPCSVVDVPPPGTSKCADGAGYISEYSTTACETTFATPSAPWMYDTTKQAIYRQFTTKKGWMANVYIGCGPKPQLVAAGDVHVTGLTDFTFTFLFTSSVVCAGSGPTQPPAPPAPPAPDSGVDPLGKHFKVLAAAYQSKNLSAIYELFNHSSSVYASHWGCGWMPFSSAVDNLVTQDFALFNTNLVILSMPMSGHTKLDYNTLSGSVKVTYMGHHTTANGSNVGVLHVGYWFATFDDVTKKFTSFQSLTRRDDAPLQQNATEMIAVTHRFIEDWKYDNMTDFARTLAPGFTANQMSGFLMNRTFFLKMHNFMWALLVDYQCQFPQSTAICDYVIDELAQTTQCKITNNITEATERFGDFGAELARNPPNPLLDNILNNKMNNNNNDVGGDGYTIVFTSEYQVHLHRIVETYPPEPGLPYQIDYLCEYEDMNDLTFVYPPSSK